MKRPLGIIVAVVVLALVGVVCLLAGLFERRMAIAQEDLVALDLADPAAEYVALRRDLERLPWAPRGALQEIARRQALLQYWHGDYAALAGRALAVDADEPADPDVQILTANALYRLAQRGPQEKEPLLKNLAAAIRAYGDALGVAPDRPDTAFNYELVVRIREEVASAKRKEDMPQIQRLDSEPNMHGEAGAPPKETKAEQFKIRVPRDPGEVNESDDPTAGPGRQRRRRG